MSKIEYKSTFGDYKLIYVFNCPYEDHKGAVKVGKASISATENIKELTPNCQKLNSAAHARIKQYTGTPAFRYELLHTELAIDDKNKSFDDYAVHDVLIRSGIKKKKFGQSSSANEWFVTDTDTVINAIKAVKEGRQSLKPGEKTTGHNPIRLRPEQEKAVKQTIQHFTKHNLMLWNAKMRFGKTICAMELAKNLGTNNNKYKKTIIITHRPDVINGWYDDFEKIFYDKPNYRFGSRTLGESFEQLERWAEKPENKFIYFASIQDLRESKAVQVDGKEGKFDKNNELFAESWDLVIVDEAHEGTQTSLGEEVVKLLRKENTKLLQLSGTPFNLLDKDDDKGIYTWDYIMEQRAKEEWKEELLGKNPYAGLPRMNILTFDISGIDPKYSAYMDDKVFNFREFFRVDENGKFIHDSDVCAFLDLMVKKDDKSNYPFSTPEYRSNFKHTFWMVPGTKEAKALSEKIQKHPILKAFKVVNVAGDGDDNTDEYDDYNEEKKALDQVKKAIQDYPDGTITISCRRLSTGVTVPEWTAVFMLAGAYSTGAASYMQTIFRVQSPANINGRIKEECYVFDFAPDRTLKVIAEAVKISSGAGRTTTQDRQIMQDLLHFCPIISYNGAQMGSYDVNNMLQQLKRVYIDRAVRTGFEDNSLFNQNLLQLDHIDMQKFAALKEIIGGSANVKQKTDIIINDIGLTDENGKLIKKPKHKEKKKLTPEQEAALEKLKEAKKNRDTARSILKAISIRIPMLIYGSNTDISKDIDIDTFIKEMDNVSWEEFMPKGVSKEVFREFSKYFDMDVFIGAGNEIRHRAKHADTLDPTNRVKYIAQLFACFKNPDKETVLTPWRVVNMHMSDCLGGYDFFNENHDEFLIDDDKEPRYVDVPKVTDEVFGPKDTKILEINSKSGLYPLYVTYTIWRKRCDEQKVDLKNVADNEKLKEKVLQIWDEVITNNVFIICKTPMAKSITQRTLCGYRDVKINAHAFENLITMIKDGKSKKFIEKAKSCDTYNVKCKEKDMKFNAVVGNPPYQETKDNTSDSPVYHLFMDVAFQLSDKVSFITPARYLFNAGKTPKAWNEKILNDEHIKVVWYKSKSTDVFPNVDIKGGVAVMFRDLKEVFGKMGVFTSYPELNSILSKVRTRSKSYLDSCVYSPESYKFTDLLYKDHPEIKKMLSSGHAYDLTSNIFEKLKDVLFFEKCPGNKHDYVKIYGKIDNERLFMWVSKNYIREHDNLLKYKVMLPKSNGSGAIGEVLSTPVVGQPVVGHTQTFISVGALETELEAENLLKYIKTKFARTMLGILKVTQDNKKAVWKYVPLQDFTSKSDINWSKSIAEIDKQLYKKYGLDKKEIDFIESMIKPME